MKYLLLPFIFTFSANAATVLTEVADFSDDPNAPTEVLLMNGVNTLSFTIGVNPANGGGTGATNGADADIFLFRVPQNSTVPEIRVTLSEGGGHFFGARLGEVFPVAPANNQAFADTLDASFVFFQGSNLALQFLADPDQDFIALFQETSDVSASVTLDITVVPEPSTTLLCFLLGIGVFNRKRRSS